MSCGQYNRKERNAWNVIAEDIGTVLRRQLVQNRIHKATSSHKKHAANLIAKSLTTSIPKLNQLPTQSAVKKVYFMGNLKSHNQAKQTSIHAEPKKVQKRGKVGSNFQTLKEIRRFYSHESEGSSGFEMRRGQEAEESKRRDGEMMRAYMHKLKIDNNVRKIYNEKEKKYRVWKARLASKRNVTLPSTLFD